LRRNSIQSYHKMEDQLSLLTETSLPIVAGTRLLDHPNSHD
jgi:hypothetical protein